MDTAIGMGQDFPYRFDPEESLCRAWRIVPHYMPSGVYTVVYIDMRDRAGNQSGIYFGDPNHGLRQEESIIDEVGPQIEMVTENPDYEPPELDLNNISIEAQPTQPDDPNGETLVTLKYRVRDNISGVTDRIYILARPTGHRTLLLHAPEGWIYPWIDTVSIFGTHHCGLTRPGPCCCLRGPRQESGGVAEIAVWDRAGNFKSYDFTEIIHFDVEGQ